MAKHFVLNHKVLCLKTSKRPNQTAASVYCRRKSSQLTTIMSSEMVFDSIEVEERNQGNETLTTSLIREDLEKKHGVQSLFR